MKKIWKMKRKRIKRNQQLIFLKQASKVKRMPKKKIQIKNQLNQTLRYLRTTQVRLTVMIYHQQRRKRDLDQTIKMKRRIQRAILRQQRFKDIWKRKKC
jgi:hypothetical protein